jgi:hypothetical protein
MIRIGAILRQTSLDEQIGDTLHALPGHAHAARDPSYGAGLIEDPAEHLPPGRSQATVGTELLSRLQKTGVEPKGREDDVGEQSASFGVGHRLRPVSARWNGATAAVNGTVHAAC